MTAHKTRKYPICAQINGNKPGNQTSNKPYGTEVAQNILTNILISNNATWF